MDVSEVRELETLRMYREQAVTLLNKQTAEVESLRADVERVREQAARIIKWAGDDEDDDQARAARLILHALDGES